MVCLPFGETSLVDAGMTARQRQCDESAQGRGRAAHSVYQGDAERRKESVPMSITAEYTTEERTMIPR
jgi:hypothetical protein